MIESEDVSGRPRPLRDIEAALRFVEADMIANMTRMGPATTGPAVIHLVTIRDALRELVGLRAELAQLNASADTNIHLDLVCGAAAHEGHVVQAAGGCGIAFGKGDLTYRCTDCNTVFHRECARKHFVEHA